MYLSNESLLVILLVGLAAGWLAGIIVQGTGLGLINDLVIGVIGAFIGDWLIPQLGIHLQPGIVGAIINATIGAVLLLLAIRLLHGPRRWGGILGGGWSGRRWGSRW
jgi:uncharacterized membrane protein YeaQ/YmgE (transglycosylase-associated protein family)